jgi:ribosomal protein L7/L12
MSCLCITIGAIAGVFVGYLAGGFLGALTGSTGVAGMGGLIAWAFCVWVGGNIGDGSFAKYFKNRAVNNKTDNYIGDKIQNRKVTRSKPLGKRVALQYINASGVHRKAYVDSGSAFRNHNKVKVNLWNSPTKIELGFERIKNPEVLGLSENPQNENEVVGKECPNCSNGKVRAWKGEMRCWNCGYVLKEENILEQHNLESASPPIIEEPIAPVLEESEAQPEQPVQPKEPVESEPVESEPAEPEPVTAEPATVNVVVTAIGMTSSEATKVLQKARPDLGTFDVYGLLRDFPKSVAENLPRDEAEKIKQELEAAGCTVELKQ